MKIILLAAILAAAIASTAYAAAAKVSLHKGKVGTYLVDSSGRTLYLFEKDKHGKSACSGACAQAWPPALTTGKPAAGKGVTASLLGTVKRSDGKTQVTYNNHPLYRFINDKKAGQATGEGVNGFGAKWWVVSAKGHEIENENESGDDSGKSHSQSPSGY